MIWLLILFGAAFVTISCLVLSKLFTLYKKRKHRGAYRKQIISANDIDNLEGLRERTPQQIRRHNLATLEASYLLEVKRVEVENVPHLIPSFCAVNSPLIANRMLHRTLSVQSDETNLSSASPQGQNKFVFELTKPADGSTHLQINSLS